MNASPSAAMGGEAQAGSYESIARSRPCASSAAGCRALAVGAGCRTGRGRRRCRRSGPPRVRMPIRPCSRAKLVPSPSKATISPSTTKSLRLRRVARRRSRDTSVHLLPVSRSSRTLPPSPNASTARRRFALEDPAGPADRLLGERRQHRLDPLRLLGDGSGWPPLFPSGGPRRSRPRFAPAPRSAPARRWSARSAPTRRPLSATMSHASIGLRRRGPWS